MDKTIFDEYQGYGIVFYKESGEIMTSEDLSEDNQIIKGENSEGLFKLKKIFLTKEVKEVKWNGLGRTSFERFEVDPENPIFQEIDGVLYTRKGYNRKGLIDRKKMIELVACPTIITSHRVIPGTIRIDCCAFKGTDITNLELPSTLEEIKASAFYMADKLKSLELPMSIKMIESQSRSNATIKYDNQSFESWNELEDYLLQHGFSDMGRTKGVKKQK